MPLKANKPDLFSQETWAKTPANYCTKYKTYKKLVEIIPKVFANMYEIENDKKTTTTPPQLRVLVVLCMAISQNAIVFMLEMWSHTVLYV